MAGAQKKNCSQENAYLKIPCEKGLSNRSSYYELDINYNADTEHLRLQLQPITTVQDIEVVTPSLPAIASTSITQNTVSHKALPKEVPVYYSSVTYNFEQNLKKDYIENKRELNFCSLDYILNNRKRRHRTNSYTFNSVLVQTDWSVKENHFGEEILQHDEPTSSLVKYKVIPAKNKHRPSSRSASPPIKSNKNSKDNEEARSSSKKIKRGTQTLMTALFPPLYPQNKETRSEYKTKRGIEEIDHVIKELKKTSSKNRLTFNERKLENKPREVQIQNKNSPIETKGINEQNAIYENDQQNIRAFYDNVKPQKVFEKDYEKRKGQRSKQRDKTKNDKFSHEIASQDLITCSENNSFVMDDIRIGKLTDDEVLKTVSNRLINFEQIRAALKSKAHANDIFFVLVAPELHKVKNKDKYKKDKMQCRIINDSVITNINGSAENTNKISVYQANTEMKIPIANENHRDPSLAGQDIELLNKEKENVNLDDLLIDVHTKKVASSTTTFTKKDVSSICGEVYEGQGQERIKKLKSAKYSSSCDANDELSSRDSKYTVFSASKHYTSAINVDEISQNTTGKENNKLNNKQLAEKHNMAVVNTCTIGKNREYNESTSEVPRETRHKTPEGSIKSESKKLSICTVTGPTQFCKSVATSEFFLGGARYEGCKNKCKHSNRKNTKASHSNVQLLRKEVSFSELNVQPSINYYASPSKILDLQSSSNKMSQKSGLLVVSSASDQSTCSRSTKDIEKKSVASEVITKKEGEQYDMAKYFATRRKNKRSNVNHRARNIVCTENLIETARKASANSTNTIGFVVEGIEPPKRLGFVENTRKTNEILRNLHKTVFSVLEIKSTYPTINSSCSDIKPMIITQSEDKKENKKDCKEKSSDHSKSKENLKEKSNTSAPKSSTKTNVSSKDSLHSNISKLSSKSEVSSKSAKKSCKKTKNPTKDEKSKAPKQPEIKKNCKTDTCMNVTTPPTSSPFKSKFTTLTKNIEPMAHITEESQSHYSSDLDKLVNASSSGKSDGSSKTRVTVPSKIIKDLRKRSIEVALELNKLLADSFQKFPNSQSLTEQVKPVNSGNSDKTSNEVNTSNDVTVPSKEAVVQNCTNKTNSSKLSSSEDEDVLEGKHKKLRHRVKSNSVVHRREDETETESVCKGPLHKSKGRLAGSKVKTHLVGRCETKFKMGRTNKLTESALTKKKGTTTACQCTLVQAQSKSGSVKKNNTSLSKPKYDARFLLDFLKKESPSCIKKLEGRLNNLLYSEQCSSSEPKKTLQCAVYKNQARHLNIPNVPNSLSSELYSSSEPRRSSDSHNQNNVLLTKYNHPGRKAEIHYGFIDKVGKKKYKSLIPPNIDTKSNMSAFQKRKIYGEYLRKARRRNSLHSIDSVRRIIMEEPEDQEKTNFSNRSQNAIRVNDEVFKRFFLPPKTDGNVKSDGSATKRKNSRIIINCEVPPKKFKVADSNEDVWFIRENSAHKPVFDNRLKFDNCNSSISLFSKESWFLKKKCKPTKPRMYKRNMPRAKNNVIGDNNGKTFAQIEHELSSLSTLSLTPSYTLCKTTSEFLDAVEKKLEIEKIINQTKEELKKCTSEFLKRTAVSCNLIKTNTKYDCTDDLCKSLSCDEILKMRKRNKEQDGLSDIFIVESKEKTSSSRISTDSLDALVKKISSHSTQNKDVSHEQGDSFVINDDVTTYSWNNAIKPQNSVQLFVYNAEIKYDNGNKTHNTSIKDAAEDFAKKMTLQCTAHSISERSRTFISEESGYSSMESKKTIIKDNKKPNSFMNFFKTSKVNVNISSKKEELNTETTKTIPTGSLAYWNFDFKKSKPKKKAVKTDNSIIAHDLQKELPPNMTTFDKNIQSKSGKNKVPNKNSSCDQKELHLSDSSTHDVKKELPFNMTTFDKNIQCKSDKNKISNKNTNCNRKDLQLLNSLKNDIQKDLPSNMTTFDKNIQCKSRKNKFLKKKSTCNHKELQLASSSAPVHSEKSLKNEESKSNISTTDLIRPRSSLILKGIMRCLSRQFYDSKKSQATWSKLKNNLNSNKQEKSITSKSISKGTLNESEKNECDTDGSVKSVSSTIELFLKQSCNDTLSKTNVNKSATTISNKSIILSEKGEKRSEKKLRKQVSINESNKITFFQEDDTDIPRPVENQIQSEVVATQVSRQLLLNELKKSIEITPPGMNAIHQVVNVNPVIKDTFSESVQAFGSATKVKKVDSPCELCSKSISTSTIATSSIHRATQAEVTNHIQDTAADVTDQMQNYSTEVADQIQTPPFVYILNAQQNNVPEVSKSEVTAKCPMAYKKSKCTCFADFDPDKFVVEKKSVAEYEKYANSVREAAQQKKQSYLRQFNDFKEKMENTETPRAATTNKYPDARHCPSDLLQKIKFYQKNVSECQEYAQKVRIEAELRKDGFMKQSEDFREVPLSFLLGRVTPSIRKRPDNVSTVPTKVSVLSPKTSDTAKDTEDGNAPVVDESSTSSDVTMEQFTKGKRFQPTESMRLSASNRTKQEQEPDACSGVCRLSGSESAIVTDDTEGKTEKISLEPFEEKKDDTKQQSEDEILKTEDEIIKSDDMIIKSGVGKGSLEWGSEEALVKMEEITPPESREATQEKPKEEDKDSESSASIHLPPGLRRSHSLTDAQNKEKGEKLEEYRRSLTDKEMFDKILETYEKEDEIVEKLSQDEQFFETQLSMVKSKESVEEFMKEDATGKKPFSKITKLFKRKDSLKEIVAPRRETLSIDQLEMIEGAEQRVEEEQTRQMETDIKMGKMLGPDQQKVQFHKDSGLFQKEKGVLGSEGSLIEETEMQPVLREQPIDIPKYRNRDVINDPDKIEAKEIGKCFRRGFRPDNIVLSGETCLKVDHSEQMHRVHPELGQRESTIDFSERESPLEYLLGLGFSVDEASNAIKDEDVKNRLNAAITEVRTETFMSAIFTFSLF